VAAVHRATQAVCANDKYNSKRRHVLVAVASESCSGSSEDWRAALQAVSCDEDSSEDEDKGTSSKRRRVRAGAAGASRSASCENWQAALQAVCGEEALAVLSKQVGIPMFAGEQRPALKSSCVQSAHCHCILM
jgi:hypothetical protein